MPETTRVDALFTPPPLGPTISHPVRFMHPDPDAPDLVHVGDGVYVEQDESDEQYARRVLDPSDPFEAALLDIVATNRRKRADYVSPGQSPWENFDRSDDQSGSAPGTSLEVLIATKQARLRALNGREPTNESTMDTLLDRAVYSIIAYARRLYPDGTVSSPDRKDTP